MAAKWEHKADEAAAAAAAVVAVADEEDDAFYFCLFDFIVVCPVKRFPS